MLNICQLRFEILEYGETAQRFSVYYLYTLTHFNIFTIHIMYFGHIYTLCM